MKLLLYADPHWSSYSSIVRSRGEKYSTRLENLISSINWVERTAEAAGCSTIVCLGDFFDKSELNSEELTALQDINWSDMSHVFLVGNHEMGRSSLEYSSSHLFKLCPRATVVDVPLNYLVGETEICFLPYVLESNRKQISEYFPSKTHKRVIFSHNDIQGIQMGKFKSTEGFPIDEVECNCDLFINGHLHNGCKVTDVIHNLGNLTGQNFSEDANLYKHFIMILDTDTLEYSLVENPYALKFYKLDFVCYPDDESGAKKICELVDRLGSNAVVTVKVSNNNDFIVRDLISSSNNIIECRVIVDMLNTSSDEVLESSSPITVDHLSQFVSYIKSQVGTSAQVLEELDKIVEG